MAAQTLEELLVLINASTDKLRDELGKGGKKVSGFRRGVDKDLDGVEKRFKKLTGSVKRQIGALAAGLGLGLLIRQASESARALEEVGRQADSLGTSVEAIQELTLTFNEFSLESNDVSDALGTLADRAQDAQDGMQSFIDDFRLLGVEVDDLRGKRPEELLSLVADRVAQIEDPTRRTAGIVRIFGDDLGRRLSPLLLQGAEGLERYAARWNELGLIIGDSGVRSAAEASEKFRELQTVLGAKFTKAVADNADRISALADILISAAEAAGKFAIAMGALAGENPFPFEEEILDAQSLLVARRKALADLQITDLTGGGSPQIDAVKEQIAELEALIRSLKEAQREELGLNGGSGGPGAADSSIFRTLEADAFRASDAVRQARERLAEFHDEQRRVNEAKRQFNEKFDLEQRYETARSSIADTSKSLDNFFKDQEKAANDADDAVRELGLTFESAFENAIVEGEKLSDVLRALLKDIIRIAARNAIINPLANLITSSLPIPGKATGGPFHSGQPFVAGERGSELIVPDVSGRVLTAAQTERMTRGGGPAFYQSFSVEAGLPPQWQAQLGAVARIAGAAAKQAVDKDLGGRR